MQILSAFKYHFEKLSKSGHPNCLSYLFKYPRPTCNYRHFQALKCAHRLIMGCNWHKSDANVTCRRVIYVKTKGRDIEKKKGLDEESKISF